MLQGLMLFSHSEALKNFRVDQVFTDPKTTPDAPHRYFTQITTFFYEALYVLEYYAQRFKFLYYISPTFRAEAVYGLEYFLQRFKF